MGRGKLEERQRRTCQLKTYLSEQEFGEVLASSQRAGLSLSEFVRRVVQGVPIHSLESQQAIRDLLKVNGDLGRLGGLLKQALARGNGRDAVYAVLHRIDRTMDVLQAKIAAL